MPFRLKANSFKSFTEFIKAQPVILETPPLSCVVGFFDIERGCSCPRSLGTTAGVQLPNFKDEETGPKEVK